MPFLLRLLFVKFAAAGSWMQPFQVIDLPSLRFYEKPITIKMERNWKVMKGGM